MHSFTTALRAYLHQKQSKQHHSPTSDDSDSDSDYEPDDVPLKVPRFSLDDLKEQIRLKKEAKNLESITFRETEYGHDIPDIFLDNHSSNSDSTAINDNHHVEPTSEVLNDSWSLQQDVSDVEFGNEWLIRKCKEFQESNPNLEVTADQLSSQIWEILSSSKSDDDIQISLVDLLGYTDFEFIMLLISSRSVIVKTINDAKNQQKQIEQKIDHVKPTTNSKLTVKPPQQQKQQNQQYQQQLEEKRPIFGAQVTVMSETEKNLQKQARKEMRKRGKANFEEEPGPGGLDGQQLRLIREEQLREAANAPLTTSDRSLFTEEKYPNVYRSGTGGSVLSLFGTRYSLPVGTQRVDNSDYEEILIPKSKPATQRPTERLIKISELEPWAQIAFKGYTSLNRVQSIVYQVAHLTNENMLVSAPTGAGKTDIAMLTVLRAISQFRNEGVIAKNEFKIIYVAPMKALAAEIVGKFSKRLAPLGITVKEMTGDMQLTKAEISATQMIVVTPEKWDVVTRKGSGDTELAQKVRLLIIDEVHLLHDDRGSVIESIVARTQRQVEASQSMIRIVGLSATLPNYVDVAEFLGVNLYQGLFYFDSGYRPIPLEQRFIGIKAKEGSRIARTKMDNACWEKVRELVADGRQVMVFVHSRKDTVKTAQFLRDQAAQEGALGLFDPKNHSEYGLVLKDVAKSRNRELKELFSLGFGIHHAGMLRSDRNMSERNFEKGLTKILCCTATLAWGVNLPAYAVVIKGTSVYVADKGGFSDLSILDVLQIFGRAGRPQYEDHGLGYIITTHDKLNHYVSAMTQQHPIESSFRENLFDNLNAEISLGTVTNVDEGVKWLSYTYLHVRMRKNPFNYGLDWKELQDDPTLLKRRQELIVSAAKTLHKSQMIVYDAKTGYLTPKDLGRTASGYYIRTATIEVFNELMRPRMTEADVLGMISMSTEFENIKVRDEEVTELKKVQEGQCMCAVKGGIDTAYGKANILLQGYISRTTLDDFALVSDTGYVAQNAARILRALFDICVSRSWGPVASVVLSLCKAVDKRMWSFEHPLAQFDLPYEIIQKIENHKGGLSIDEMREMDVKEIGQLIRHQKLAGTVLRCVEQFPVLSIEASIAPITRTVLRGILTITADFIWNDKVHGSVEPWWIFIEDGENTEILHCEYFLLTKQMSEAPQKLTFTIPIPKVNSTVDELPPQIFARAVSNKWMGAETIIPISFKHLILPAMYRTPHTELLNLQPLPISALKNPVLEEICGKRFQYFNPVQTQIFHTLYYTQHNALVGAPTGSGKTVAAELALWAAFRDNPHAKVVYIAPLKALVRERVADWRARLTGPMNRSLIELTGDVTPDIQTIKNADIIITTPEKWDGISRSWQSRSYVTSVSLIIIDEIHLLGSDRGPILEVIVSRMNYVASQTGNKVRFVGLSTALANASDLADWLGIKEVGMFNFKHSVRPVPLEIYIDGFPGQHYCPRMGTMNKPTYKAIMTHSPTKPVIVFVSSRRQTRLTAIDLISLCAMETDPKHFLHMPDEDIAGVLQQVKDVELKNALEFGMGLHHAGLVESDRKIVEELFLNNKIQILIATSTLAWGVNFPAHLVVIKGTEYYDAKVKGYVDFPITDVLQMMGRAGRPQFDDSGVARIFVQDAKKNFYKKFLHEPFPVESCLHTVLHDHINAEIVGGTIKSKQDALDYLSWTYLYRRIHMNPTYYGVEDTTEKGIAIHLSALVDQTLADLEKSSCAIVNNLTVEPTSLARIASFYYIHHSTMAHLKLRLTPDYRERGNLEIGERADGDFGQILRNLSDVPEYLEIPVRHNEDKLNATLAESVPIPLFERWKPGMSTFGNRLNNPLLGYESAHVKTFLLFQAHLSRLQRLPCADYFTDQITVLDSSIRISQAMIDVAADQGYLTTSLAVMKMLQCIKQALWPLDSSLLSLPHLTTTTISDIKHLKTNERLELSELVAMKDQDVSAVLSKVPQLSKSQIEDIRRVIWNMPSLSVSWTIEGGNAIWENGTPSGRFGTNTNWIIDGDVECMMKIEIKRRRPYKRVPMYQQRHSGQENYCVYAPKFPKPQTESWWIVIGEREVDDLLALKRVAPAAKKGTLLDVKETEESDGRIMKADLKFLLPAEAGVYELSLFLVCDGYLGLDREFKFKMTVR